MLMCKCLSINHFTFINPYVGYIDDFFGHQIGTTSRSGYGLKYVKTNDSDVQIELSADSV